ncbi:MAG: outer membrane protein assembly factor [Sphingobacteriales bacterium JAD_PAG50586_3]|nr:MAG: outer membrane protein assembly factor [Sphingobacteriales bacterium JAD_PAG50586_3]
MQRRHDKAIEGCFCFNRHTTFFTPTVNAQLFKRFFGPPDTTAKPKRNKILAIPVISRAPETDWTFGAAATWLFKTSQRDSLLRTSNVQLIGIYTLRNQYVGQLDANIVLPGERWYLKIHGSASRFPDSFWGVGNTMPESNKERYTFDQYHINPTLMRMVKPKLFAGLIYDFQRFYNIQYTPGGIFDQQQLPGRTGSLISGAGATVLVDSRDNLYNAYKGWYAQFISLFYGKGLGSKFTYNQFILDTRKYLKVYRRHILALQAYFEYNGPGTPPFRNMARMGGPERMRGYYSGRFTDKTHVCFQAEYRFPIWWRFGGTAFASAGEVAPAFKK